MTAYVLRRLLHGIPIILGVTLITFILFHVFGGNPVASFLGKNATAADIAAMEKEYGFDKSMTLQYLDYLYQILRFDFGRSFATREPVTDMIRSGVGPSLSLTLPALLLTSIISVSIALISAFFRGRLADRLLVFFAVVGMSVSFLVYIVLGQYLLAFKLPLFQIHGYEAGLVDRWQYLSLPIIVMVVVGMGYDTRFYRSVMVEETTKDYIVTAFAKGLSRRRVMFVHMLKNASIPIITRMMISVPFLVTGSLLLESFFGIPGMGNMLLTALDQADLPVIKAYTVIISILFVVSNIATDILYAIFDPRVKLS